MNDGIVQTQCNVIRGTAFASVVSHALIGGKYTEVILPQRSFPTFKPLCSRDSDRDLSPLPQLF